MTASRRLAAAAGAAAALPLALAATRFHRVPLDAGGEWRGLSDPPGLARLALAAALAALVALALRRRPPAAARALLPLLLAAVPLVPVLVGVGDPLLAFQGAALAPLVGAALAVAALEDARARALRPGSGALFVVAAVLFTSLGAWLPGPAGPQGDEPHYLVMTQSLLSDGDLDLRDEFDAREYAPFFPGSLTPHASPASPPDRLYSIHSPGLPLLLLPAYALGGYPGARLLMGLLAAAAAALAHRLLREVTGRDGLALAAWAALALTPPLPFFAVALYPEVPAALGTALLLLAARRDDSAGAVWVAGLTAAALPWIHPRLLPLAATGLALSAARRGPRGARLAAALLAAASLAGLLGYYRAHYGSASLAAAYGPGFADDVSLAHAPRGAAALLFDRQFGLIPLSPVWALALPGAALLARRRAGDALRALLLAGASFGVGASFSMWWGGASPPARFAVPALPAAALLLAPAIARAPRLAAAATGWGAAVVALAAGAPRALHNRLSGESGLAGYLAPGLDLDASLPSFVTDAGARPWLLSAALALGLALVWRYRARGLAAVALAWAVAAAPLAGGSLADPDRAAAALLEVWDRDNLRGPALDLSRLRIGFDLREAPWEPAPDEILVSRRLDVPPGRYRLVVRGRAVDAVPTLHVMRLDLTADGLVLAREYLEEGHPDPVFEVPMPIGARRLTLTGRGIEGRARVDAVALSPLALVPRGRRAALPWPLRPDQDRYRVGADGVRATALDWSLLEAGGFRLDGDTGLFAVEAPVGGSVRVRVIPRAAGAGDRLEWGARQVRLGAARALLRLPADEGEPLGDTAVVPVRLHSRDAWIGFEAESGGDAPPPL